MRADKNMTCLVGKFSKAKVQIAGEPHCPVDPSKFEGSSYYDIDFDIKNPEGEGLIKHTYRFLNPDYLSPQALEVLKKQPNAHVFGDDLSNSLITVDRTEGIRVETGADLVSTPEVN